MPDKETTAACDALQPTVAEKLNKQLDALGDEGICKLLDISANSPVPAADIAKLLKEHGFSDEEITRMNTQAATLAGKCPDHYGAVLDNALPRVKAAKENTGGCNIR